MIGLLKPSYNNHPDAKTLKANHWLSYCSACKMIGSEYGHIYRLGLNYDLALLGELAADAAGLILEKEQVKPRQCFRKAEHDEQTEKLMRYIAALHMFWYEIKLKDNAADEKTWYWRFLSARTGATFRKAEAALAEAGADLPWIKTMLMHQHELEQADAETSSDIHTYAKATGSITAHMFQKAVQLAGAPEHAPAFAELGERIGRALYITDAAEDLEEDAIKERFNPFETLLDGESDKKKQTAQRLAIQAWEEALEKADRLPCSETTKTQLNTRMQNVKQLIAGECCGGGCSMKTGEQGTSQGMIQKARRFAAAASATLIPVAVSAQAHRQDDDSCSDTCAGICCCGCASLCCLTLVGTPNQSANCACDCCCADQEGMDWYR